MIMPIISSVLLIISLAVLFGLTPEQITSDLLMLITPNESLKEKVRNLRGNRKKHGIYKKLIKMKAALEASGKSRQFTLVCTCSLILFAAGVILSLLINNIYLMPAVTAAFALLPFFYTANTIAYYEKHTKAELETSLSIITTSYTRNNDIVESVRENIGYIKPPLREVFQAFVVDATSISSNITGAILNLKDKVDDDIFGEWCDTLKQCQDDSTQKDTLLSVVSKLADVRQVNTELKTMLSSARMEYLTMVALVIGNIPLLYILNKDWFNTLLFSTPGKITCGICGVVILVTALFMMKFTKPIEYKR